jgi:hypothetical protein
MKSYIDYILSQVFACIYILKITHLKLIYSSVSVKPIEFSIIWHIFFYGGITYLLTELYVSNVQYFFACNFDYFILFGSMAKTRVCLIIALNTGCSFETHGKIVLFLGHFGLCMHNKKILYNKKNVIPLL